jgi:hypothetical protein
MGTEGTPSIVGDLLRAATGEPATGLVANRILGELWRHFASAALDAEPAPRQERTELECLVQRRHLAADRGE